jgi:uncharacterized protein (DUF983 family)
MLFKKGTKLYSILFNKCPKCQEGDFFIDNHFFHFKKLLKIHDNCSHCNLKYMMEPSFYFGAMFVNYALTVGISILVFLATHFLLKFNLLQSFIGIVIILAIFSLHTLRLSRIIWINIFVNYTKDSSLDASLRSSK